MSHTWTKRLLILGVYIPIYPPSLRPCKERTCEKTFRRVDFRQKSDAVEFVSCLTLNSVAVLSTVECRRLNRLCRTTVVRQLMWIFEAHYGLVSQYEWQLMWIFEAHYGLVSQYEWRRFNSVARPYKLTGDEVEFDSFTRSKVDHVQVGRLDFVESGWFLSQECRP